MNTAAKILPIAMFGGSFNPVHRGHIRCMSVAHGFALLDLIYMVPAYISPFKQIDMADDTQHRLNMCKLATKDYPYVEVCDLEISRGGVSYSIDTVKQLLLQGVLRYEGADVHTELIEGFGTDLENVDQSGCGYKINMIVGADMLKDMDKWHNSDVLLSMVRLIVINRPVEFEAKKVASAFEDALYIDVEALDIASADIREMLARGCEEELYEYLDKDVFSYIKENALYGCKAR
ncbi:MAG: nicotinate (nicotinamide) nucleotide adenylyltransferase [Eggerthellaceae bacterium]|nr:nicotinate (nicotinamide) nucleotide adenylyltransferase [Eggerthellaceae bacterium]